MDIEITLFGVKSPGIAEVRKDAFLLGGQRVRDGGRGRLQRAFLRYAQRALQFVSILASRPRQYQRRDRDQQQLKADAHSTQR